MLCRWSDSDRLVAQLRRIRVQENPARILLVASAEEWIKKVVPVHLTSDFNERLCSDSSVRRSVVVDSIPPKIETRIP